MQTSAWILLAFAALLPSAALALDASGLPPRAGGATTSDKPIAVQPGSTGPIGEMCATAPGAAVCRTLRDRAAERLSVKDFGAKMDGTSDAAAFAAARAAAGDKGEVLVPPGRFNAGTPVAGSPNPIFWKLSGNKYGTGSVPVTMIGRDHVTTVLDGGTVIMSRADNHVNQPSVLRIDGKFEADALIDTPGTVAAFEVNGEVPAVRHPNFVWANRSVLRSSAYGNGQHVALSGSTFRPPNALADGKGQRSPIWGAYAEATSQTGRPSNEDGILHGMEINVGSNGADPDNFRVGLLISAGIGNTKKGSYSQVGTGISVGAGDGLEMGTFFRPRGNFYQAGLSFLDVVPVDKGAGPPPVIQLKQGQYVSFDETNTLSLREVTGVLQVRNGNQETWRLTGQGATEQFGRVKAPFLNIPDFGSPSSSSDPTGTVGDTVFNGPYMYRKTTSGWLRFTGSKF